MQPSLFYGEISSHIADHLYHYPDRIMQIDRSLPLGDDPDQTIYSIIGNASHVFATIQDLFDNEDLNWLQVVTLYSDELLDSLIIGNNPKTIDFLDMVVRSIYTNS